MGFWVKCLSKLNVKTIVVSVRTEQDRRCMYPGNEEVSKRMCVGGPCAWHKRGLGEVAGWDRLCN